MLLVGDVTVVQLAMDVLVVAMYVLNVIVVHPVIIMSIRMAIVVM
jgi:hypothetical protein